MSHLVDSECNVNSILGINEADLFQVEVSKSYGFTEWREDMKKLLMKVGISAKSVVFLFCDSQVFEWAYSSLFLHY